MFAFQKYISDLVEPQYKRVGTSDQGDLLIRYVNVLDSTAEINLQLR